MPLELVGRSEGGFNRQFKHLLFPAPLAQETLNRRYNFSFGY